MLAYLRSNAELDPAVRYSGAGELQAEVRLWGAQVVTRRLCAYESALRATNPVSYWCISSLRCSGSLSGTLSTSRHRAEVKVEAMAVRVVAPSGWLGSASWR